MRLVVRSHPGEVVLLAIGPLTNVAQLFEADPELPSLLGGLVIMGGVFTAERRAIEPWERNTSADPHATERVYAARAPIHRSVGLDVTRRAALPADDARERMRGRYLGPVTEWMELWLRDRDVVCFNDPLAAATIFDEDVCRFARGTVEVEVASAGKVRPDERGSESKGESRPTEKPTDAPGGETRADIPRAATRFTPGDRSSPHEVALEVDVDRFFDGFWQILGQP
jgi:purine nucleosidase